MLTKPSGVRSLILGSPALSIPRLIHDADSLRATLPDSVQELIVRHENDGTTDEAGPSTVRYYRSLVPGAQIAIVENSGHLTMHDQPDRYLKVVRDFLHRVEGS
jgi:proline iminopeptidase